MDKLTAAELLGISPEATQREVKRAYANMLKIYHPEEHPEEFRRIHDAYECLMKGEGQWQAKEPAEPAHLEKPRSEGKDPQIGRAPEEEADRKPGKFSEEEKDPQAEMFRRAEEKARIEEQARQKMDIEFALQELKHLILTKSRRYKAKEYRTFFSDARTCKVMNEPKFVDGLGQLLETWELNRSCYQVIIGAYALRDRDFQKMTPQEQRLYIIIEDYTKIHKNAALLPGITGGLGTVVVITVRNMRRSSEMMAAILLILCMAAAAGILLYKLFVLRSSRQMTHILTAVSLFVLLFGCAMFVPETGSNADAAMNSIIFLMIADVLYFIGTLIWLIVHKSRIASRRRQRGW